MEVGRRRIGLEMKRTDQPRLTPSMRHALSDLALDRLIVVHAGHTPFPLTDQVDATRPRPPHHHPNRLVNRPPVLPHARSAVCD